MATKTKTEKGPAIEIGRETILVTLAMESYIAHPYWPERDTVISIQKKSGMNRAQTDATREKALKSYLDNLNLSMADFRELCRRAERPWYRADNEDQSSPIVIPRHQLSGSLVQAVKTAPSSVRGKYREESLRHYLRLSDLRTEKTVCDDVFERYVKLETSNQRSLQRNEVLRRFQAAGTIEVEPDTKLEDVRRLFDYAVREIGVGSSRKMGYGRGTVGEFEWDF